MPDALLVGLRRRLVADAIVSSTFQTPAGYPQDVWVFQRKLTVQLEGTEQVACVVSRRGGWSPPNVQNTMRFPRVLIEVYADPERDAQRNIIESSAEGSAYAAWDPIDKVLHRARGDQEQWGDVRTLGCQRLEEPSVDPAEFGDGMVVLSCFYGVVVG